MAEAGVAHQQLVNFWAARSLRRPACNQLDGESIRQREFIECLLRERLKPTDYFQDMLDFGCGIGRFVPFWQNYSGHIWAVDILENDLKEITSNGINITPVNGTYPPVYSDRIPPVDLFWSCLVLQHIVDDFLFSLTIAELSKVIKPGARVIILDNAVDVARHVRPRGPDGLAGALGLRKDLRADKVTINKTPKDHWLIDGFKA